jgi:hypothetical protein
MAVSFELTALAAQASLVWSRSSLVVVRVPATKVRGKLVERDTPGDAVVEGVRPLDLTGPFDDIREGEYRLVNREAFANVRPGDTRIGAVRVQIKHIRIEFQVELGQRLNSLATAARRGSNGRVLAVPEYGVRARALILFDWVATHEMQVWKHSRWQADKTLPGGSGTNTERGPRSANLRLPEAMGEPFEPPVGVAYNAFRIIDTGSYLKNVSMS